MCPNSEQYENVCKAEFGEIKAKLDKLDEAIRGNGKPGIHSRLERLELAEAIRSKLLWIITAATVTGAVALVWRLVQLVY
jgi:hypothetical protein